MGDARLSLATGPVGRFDLLILDAFSSDSVPVHLLTREAMATYAHTLRPGGLILFHLSNRYYELPIRVNLLGGSSTRAGPDRRLLRPA